MKISEKLLKFLKEEEGKITSQAMLTVGAFTSIAGMGISEKCETDDNEASMLNQPQPLFHSSQPVSEEKHDIDYGKLFTEDKGWIDIKSIERVEEEVKVYNIHVDGENNFFANQVLAHNKSCFVAGTKVKMIDGSFKAIETIKEGDKVIGINNEVHTVVGFDSPVIGNRGTYLINGKLEITPDHLMTAMDGTWKAIKPDIVKKELLEIFEVSQLEEGDLLLTEESSEIVDSIEFVGTRPKEERVYNLILNADKEFQVYIAEGFIVHNYGIKIGEKNLEKNWLNLFGFKREALTALGLTSLPLFVSAPCDGSDSAGDGCSGFHPGPCSSQ